MARWRARTHRPRSAAASKPADWQTLLGRKISIRYRLHDDPEHPFSEAIGVVSAIQQTERGESIAILTRRGETVEVATDDVLALKEFPSA